MAGGGSMLQGTWRAGREGYSWCEMGKVAKDMVTEGLDGHSGKSRFTCKRKESFWRVWSKRVTSLFFIFLKFLHKVWRIKRQMARVKARGKLGEHFHILWHTHMYNPTTVEGYVYKYIDYNLYNNSFINYKCSRTCCHTCNLAIFQEYHSVNTTFYSIIMKHNIY